MQQMQQRNKFVMWQILEKTNYGEVHDELECMDETMGCGVETGEFTEQTLNELQDWFYGVVNDDNSSEVHRNARSTFRELEECIYKSIEKCVREVFDKKCTDVEISLFSNFQDNNTPCFRIIGYRLIDKDKT